MLIYPLQEQLRSSAITKAKWSLSIFKLGFLYQMSHCWVEDHFHVDKEKEKLYLTSVNKRHAKEEISCTKETVKQP